MQIALETTIEWGDCDEAGIVFYPRYFYWMDCAYQGFLRSRGLNQRKLRADFGAFGTTLVAAKADFISPATYDQPLSVEAEVARWGRSSFQVAYRGTSAGKIIFVGEETRIWGVSDETAKMRPSPIPFGIRRALQSV